MRDQLVAEISTWQHTTLATGIHASGGIRTHNLRRQADPDLRLTPSGQWDLLKRIYIYFLMPPHFHIDCVVSPPGSFEVGTPIRRLLCSDYVSDGMYERGVPGGALNLNSTGYPDHGHYRDLSLQGKIPKAEPGIDPRSSWLVVRSSGRQDTRLVIGYILNLNILSIIKW
jgi:hypothetical protein